jgi:erythromycin esterase-like protein
LRCGPVRPAHPQSYERLFHLTNVPGLILPLRSGASDEVQKKLMKPLLERAIGVIYRPESELASHYFEAILPRQFDEYIWVVPRSRQRCGNSFLHERSASPSAGRCRGRRHGILAK